MRKITGYAAFGGSKYTVLLDDVLTEKIHALRNVVLSNELLEAVVLAESGWIIIDSGATWVRLVVDDENFQFRWEDDGEFATEEIEIP